jgi:hypothetical protein
MFEQGDQAVAQIPPHLLEPDEKLELTARTQDAILAVTDRRIIVADEQRVALAVQLEGLRRIQFDIERTRPATLVIVPENASYQPQVLAIPPEEFDRAASALALIGRRLAGQG